MEVSNIRLKPRCDYDFPVNYQNSTPTQGGQFARRVYLSADAAYNPANPAGTAQPVPLQRVNEELNNLSINNNNNAPVAGASPFGTPVNGVPGASPRLTDSPVLRPSNGWSAPQSPIVSQRPESTQNSSSSTSNHAGEVIPLSIAPEVQCPPTFLRMTYNNIPQTKALANKSNIPFGCIMHPLARPQSQSDVIPVVSPGLCGVVRCRRCRSYINPFALFVDGGRRWRCNFCYLTNDVPTDYYSPLDATGRRTDLADRPELQRRVVDEASPPSDSLPEYMVRPPQPATYFFLIDASFYAISSGMFHMTIETIRRTLDEFPGSPRTRIGFITFNSSLHFYNLRSTLSKPQMLVVTDLSEVFLPLPDDLLVNLVDSRAIVDTLLTKLPSMFPVTQNVDSAYGMALKCAFELIKPIGGKIISFVSTLPSMGDGKLPNREDSRIVGTDKETILFNPSLDDKFYKDLAMDCSRAQISIDTFIFSSHQFLDVATLSSLSQFTGGENYFYLNFRSDTDGEKLFHDLRNNILRETGFEAVFRVRCSKAVNVESQYGNFFVRSTDLLALPNVDADKSYAFQFQLVDNNVSTKYVSIQAALLYTTTFGERRIRIMTQCLAVTNSLADIFRSSDVGAVTTLLTKIAVEKALSSKLSDARDMLVNRCVDILTVYKTDLASRKENTQLLLPEALKLLPLYILSVTKSTPFRLGTEVKPDERTYFLNLFRISSVQNIISLVYPTLYNMTNLHELATPGTEEFVTLPNQVNLNSEHLSRSGMLLLEDSQQMILWLGRDYPQQNMYEIFGIPTLEGVDLSTLQLPQLETPLSVKLHTVLNAIRSQKSVFLPLRIVREGEGREYLFTQRLVEDKMRNSTSYYDFLVLIHQRIQKSQ
ncbi:protein transport protein Sec24-like protein [Planoprotostelium fungivorum]|uniref:Protein transport protein Sec24-like protein n=1 Tax=Planoprotostelium fungivorum TaxID=1890364 RepID=A0A2P6NWY6_9EUKA|nr:protein transport protein Sec24-like protein [Planoprotostelium fungivorum]